MEKGTNISPKSLGSSLNSIQFKVVEMIVTIQLRQIRFIQRATPQEQEGSPRNILDRSVPKLVPFSDQNI